MKITGVIVTKNEESNIRECLKSINWLDEIIVVDANSEDKTREIASEFTSKIYTGPWFNIFHLYEMRRFSLTKASNSWVLFLDADERVTEELKSEINKLKLNETENKQVVSEVELYDGFLINRKNYFLGQLIKHCGIYPDYKLKLFKKEKASIPERLVHENVVINGKIGKLKNDILHFSNKNLEDVIYKINYYSTPQAEEFCQKGKEISKIGVFTHAISAFLRVFISRKGYRDGLYGFFVSFTDAFTNFLTHLKLLKLHNMF